MPAKSRTPTTIIVVPATRATTVPAGPIFSRKTNSVSDATQNENAVAGGEARDRSRIGCVGRGNRLTHPARKTEHIGRCSAR